MSDQTVKQYNINKNHQEKLHQERFFGNLMVKDNHPGGCANNSN